MVADFQRLVETLVSGRVDFVVIGGVALVLHGSARTTQDLDICYARRPDNLARLAKALEPLHPTLRGAPAGLPFVLDARALRTGLNFTLQTEAGDLDLLGEVTGAGGYEAIVKDAKLVELYGHSVHVMDLTTLEKAKRAAGRIKDVADLADILELMKKQ